MNLALIIEDHDAERIALLAEGEPTTYGELRSWAAIVRTRLAADGIGVNGRVVLACGNEPAFAPAALGVMGVGGVAVPVNPRSPLPELLSRIELVRPSALLVGPSMGWVLDHAAEVDVPLIDMTNLGEQLGDSPPIVERGDDDLAFMMLTSGVTGEPKAAMLSHGNLGWVQELTCDGGPDSMLANDVTLGVLPFAHIFGLNVVLLSSLRAGATCVLQDRFDTDESLELVRRHCITRIAGVPPMWKRWAEADVPDDTMASVVYAASGAATLPLAVFEAIRDRYGIAIAEGYGLTETSPIITNSRGITIKPTSVGQVVAGVELALVDPDGTPVDRGDVGEIVVRGPGIFAGYLDAPDITASVLTDDGWFWTGDVGVLDDDGYLFLVDRVKDLIIVSGFNV
ncbi:MAG: AMP-binding protein, partial [Acidimicrobiia bacterium]|nr:AMP-binding protein [Acidimicrobiia bacterium]